ncbi:MAG: HMA2 domain-containing protein [Dissulfurispiraceae bacterium]|jgi:hypothetical protein
MIPKVHIVHRTPTRLRLKVVSKGDHEGYLRTLPEKFAGFSGIDEIAINPLTGSVLFKHGGNGEEMIDFIKKHGIFEIAVKPVRPPSVHNGVSSIYQNLDSLVNAVSNGSTNTGGLAFIALLSYGVLQISRGNIAGPAWYTAFWYALNIFLKSQPGEITPDIEAS